jgi:Gpi18-like mannosyltransferase
VVLDSLIHWDAGWFLRIAGQGYDFNSAPFFPMFPLLIRLLTFITGNGVEAGFLVSNTALFFACFLLYHLVKEDYGEDIASTTVFIMLFFPDSHLFFINLLGSASFSLFSGSFLLCQERKMAGGIIIGRLCSPDQEHRYRLVFCLPVFAV